MYISIMCHKGPVSGPRVKVSVELVRPPGLLYFFCLFLRYMR